MPLRRRRNPRARRSSRWWRGRRRVPPKSGKRRANDGIGLRRHATHIVALLSFLAPVERFVLHQAPASGLSMTASGLLPWTKLTVVIPRSLRSWSSGTFIGPGDGAVPGAGWGNAVDIAVWNDTWPSTFRMIWWM